LFEAFVAAALEFVVGGHATPYGKERRFERRSDGLLLMNGRREAALYDAKAYTGGFSIEADDMRRFTSYVEEFRKRYKDFLELCSFLVVSGSFLQSGDSLAKCSRELLARSAVPLVAIDADTLARTVELLAARPVMRRSIDWRRLFVEPQLSVDAIQREIDAVRKDRVVPRSGDGNLG
jgi:hypothetical protein